MWELCGKVAERVWLGDGWWSDGVRVMVGCWCGVKVVVAARVGAMVGGRLVGWLVWWVVTWLRW